MLQVHLKKNPCAEEVEMCTEWIQCGNTGDHIDNMTVD
jgi:hypothetical protein